MPVLPGVNANRLVVFTVVLSAAYVPDVAPTGTVCLYAPAGNTSGPPWHVVLTGYWFLRWLMVICVSLTRVI